MGINLNTVSRVYTLLKDAGYIQIRHGRGAVINAVPTMHEGVENYAEALFPYIIEMRSQGITKAQVEELIDDLWEQSIKGGKEPCF